MCPPPEESACGACPRWLHVLDMRGVSAAPVRMVRSGFYLTPASSPAPAPAPTLTPTLADSAHAAHADGRARAIRRRLRSQRSVQHSGGHDRVHAAHAEEQAGPEVVREVLSAASPGILGVSQQPNSAWITSPARYVAPVVRPADAHLGSLLRPGRLKSVTVCMTDPFSGLRAGNRRRAPSRTSGTSASATPARGRSRTRTQSFWSKPGHSGP